MARVFVWLSTSGGVWAVNTNWADTTDGISPSLIAPTAADSVSVTGASGAALQTISGPGVAAAAFFAGNTALSGSFNLGAFTLGAAGAGGVLELAAASQLAGAAGNIVSGSLIGSTGASLSLSGALTLGPAQNAGQSASAGGSLSLTGGAQARMMALFLNSAVDSIYVDPASIVEIGTLGTGRAGQLTIDPGRMLQGQGNANAYGAVANNGTIQAAGGTLSVGTLSGIGTLQIGAGATLALNGATGAGQSISFTGANATLTVNEGYYTPGGTLTGFAPGDAIDMWGDPISAASFAPTGQSGGLLTLYYATQVAAQFHLAGSYTGDVFLTSGDGANGTLITLAQAASGGGTASAGTKGPDIYSWTGPVSGAWNTAANWQDQTSGAAPAMVAPGANNLVNIAASQGSFTVIAGPANAASLSVTGEVALSGAYAIGTLSVGQASYPAFTNGTLDLLPGTAIGAGTLSLAAGEISVAGSATHLSVTGTLTLGGGISGVGLPVVSLSVTAGGAVQTGAIVVGGGSGASIVTDPTSSVEIGTLGGAAAGAITIDSGASLTGNGSVNPYDTLLNNGNIVASGGVLTLGAVTGNGSLSVAAGASLELLAATAAPIALNQNTAAGGSTLEFYGARAAPTGIITGMAPGDVIDLEGSPLTVVQFSGNVLSLLYNTTVVARLTLAGVAAGARFFAVPDGNGGTEITEALGGGGTGGSGQTGTDQLTWTNPVSGNWSNGSFWTDTTLGKSATLPPGAATPAVISGGAGAAFVSISGTGSCASLALIGNTALSGSIAVGGLVAVGQAATGTLSAVAATLDVPNSTLTASQIQVLDGSLLSTGVGAVVSVSGTLLVGGSATDIGAGVQLSAQGHGGIIAGSLSMGAAVVTVDAISFIEVGTLGGAAAGALTVDAGAQASGSGLLDTAGLVIDNGLIMAAGGTLVVGNVVGAGTLSIGTEAALTLDGTASVPIAMTGGGASLVLPGNAVLPTGVISGFALGDSIFVGAALSGATYTPGPLGVGTLSLMAGALSAGQLLLAGNFAGEVFGVQPDGGGVEITLSSSPTITAPSGPPAGTASADVYVWLGGAGGAWNAASNWTDSSTGQSPAAVAPGQFDKVSIAGSVSGTLAITGPADAASLLITGAVSLAGSFAVGGLTVGSPLQTGALALSSFGTVAAASATVVGALAVNGGALTVGGTLTLQGGGTLSAGGASAVQLGGVQLVGGAAALSTSGTATVQVGGLAPDSFIAPGSVTIEAGGVVAGAGGVNLAGQTVDQGTLAASGGTLLVGSVSGSGTLLVGPLSDLVLNGPTGTSLTIDFAGPGTLTVGVAPKVGAPLMLGGVVQDFGIGDEILLPVSGATSAQFGLLAPSLGLLTVWANTVLLAEMYVAGSQILQNYAVTSLAGGGTMLTPTLSNMLSQGDTQMSNTAPSGGSQPSRAAFMSQINADFPYVTQGELDMVIGSGTVNLGIYEWYSADGSAPLDTLYGAGQIGVTGVNVEEVGPISGSTISAIAESNGYSAVFLQGTESIGLTDKPAGDTVGIGNSLLVGNTGNDNLAALGNNDTLVGGTGQDTFYAALPAGAAVSSDSVNVYIYGNGRDLIATNNDNADIVTSTLPSTVALGASDNNVTINGADTVACEGGANAVDFVTVSALAGAGGNVIFGPFSGELNFVGGATPSTVVGAGGQLYVTGGSASGNELWAANSPFEYFAGSGSATIVGGNSTAPSGVYDSTVVGGEAPVTVFGGTGPGFYQGVAGSAFVVGDGPTTIEAVAGNDVYLVGNAPVDAIAVGDGVDVYGGVAFGNSVFQAGIGNESLWGGAGNDTFIASSGTTTLVGGSGDNVFSFTNGAAGGKDIIVGWTANDVINLNGYTDTVPPVQSSFGDAVLSLSDGTQIIVEAITSIASSQFTFG